MKCNFCGQEYEFSLGHRCEVMQEESKQTQPDLVSKLRERITDYLKGGGLFNPEMAEHDRVRELLIDCHVALLDLEVSPSTPIQPEISRSVQRREAIQRGEPMPTFAPSTPIVPGTAGLSALADEIKLLLKMAEDCDARGEVQSPQKEWTFYQGKIVAYKTILSLLGAAKPAEGCEFHGNKPKLFCGTCAEELTMPHKLALVEIERLTEREARIRKDVLEEAAQHVPMSYRQGFDRFWIECTCGWNKDGVIATGILPNPTLWANHIRALAERPAPAGEVRISRWRCPHCAHVNLMISSHCENCKIPLINTTGKCPDCGHRAHPGVSCLEFDACGCGQ